MKAKALLIEFAKSALALIVVFAILEALLRVAYFVRTSMVDYVLLPYGMKADYGPIPPWMDGVRITETKDAVTWIGRPNLQRTYIDVFSPARDQEERRSLLRQFIPRVPAAFKENPVWKVSLNSDGFRDEEFAKEKAASSFRIVCLGDSWTFGSNVGQSDAYPQQLESLLREEFPSAHFEVLNFGMLGYASYHGLNLFRKVIEFEPDLVVIGFAMNEIQHQGLRSWAKKNPDLIGEGDGLWKSVGDLISENIEVYRLLDYWAMLINWRPNPIDYHLEKSDETWQWEYESAEPWLKDSAREYEANILDMVTLAAGHGTSVILLYPEFWTRGPYNVALHDLATAEELPLVDASALLADARGQIERELERALSLVPSDERQAREAGEDTTDDTTEDTTEDMTVIFRVYAGERPVPDSLYIAGNHAQLGNSLPNKVPMYDDGTHGDQVAGDRVWSYAAKLPREKVISYTYTNSGAEGKWQGLDVPAIRQFMIEPDVDQAVYYAPIDTFGEIYMRADPWHTNKYGYGLIAQALLEKLQEDEAVRRYLDGNAGM